MRANSFSPYSRIARSRSRSADGPLARETGMGELAATAQFRPGRAQMQTGWGAWGRGHAAEVRIGGNDKVTLLGSERWHFAGLDRLDGVSRQNAGARTTLAALRTCFVSSPEVRMGWEMDLYRYCSRVGALCFACVPLVFRLCSACTPLLDVRRFLGSPGPGKFQLATHWRNSPAFLNAPNPLAKPQQLSGQRHFPSPRPSPQGRGRAFAALGNVHCSASIPKRAPIGSFPR